MQFFTAEQLTAEMVRMATDLGQYREAQRLAPGALGSSTRMERNRVMCTTTLASSYLPKQGNVASDIDRACELLGQVIPSLSSLTSTRTLEWINSVRRVLSQYTGLSSVQEIEEQFQSHIAAGMAPR